MQECHRQILHKNSNIFFLRKNCSHAMYEWYELTWINVHVYIEQAKRKRNQLQIVAVQATKLKTWLCYKITCAAITRTWKIYFCSMISRFFCGCFLFVHNFFSLLLFSQFLNWKKKEETTFCQYLLVDSSMPIHRVCSVSLYP